jgi:uncharacterized hydantoinase/oxoprolinase family protein
MLDETALDAIAGALAEAQVERVVSSVRQVRARHADISRAVVTGLGDFIAAEAAGRAGLAVVRLSEHVGEAARNAPAVAVAWLLAEQELGRPW